MEGKINTIIFDLGRVLVRFEPREGLRRMGFPEETVQAFMDRIFAGVWEECDGLRMTPEETMALFKKTMPEYTREVEIFWEHVSMLTGVFDYSSTWLKSLKEEGYRLLVLSNFGETSFKIVSRGYDFLELMDGGVISYEVQTTKPGEQIYRILMERYGVSPEEAVFIDDRPENVETARRIGMQGIVFRDYEQAKQDLALLLR